MNELKCIEELVAKYCDLLYFGDTSLIDSCFFPEATVNSIENDEVVSIDIDGFRARLRGRHRHPVSVRIELTP